MGVVLRRVIKVLTAAGLLLVALFCWNGLASYWRVPVAGVTEHPARVLPGEAQEPTRLTLMAWNIAKCGFHRGGTTFKTKDEVRARLDRIAAVIVEREVDLLFLSEVVLEAAPCQVNQVAYLAEKAGFTHWCYGDNYSFGIPGARIRSGNAILSKVPMVGKSVHQLPGGAPFWNPSGNRRILWADVFLRGDVVQCASLRNDSFDLENNAAQVQAILDDLSPGPTAIAGDFNAAPGTEPLRRWEASGRFAGIFDGPPTFPASAPNRRIDTVLLPIEWLDKYNATWTHEVLDVNLSDHEPVVVKSLVRLGP